MKKIFLSFLCVSGLALCVSAVGAEPAPAECQQYADDIQEILPKAAAFGAMTARKVQLLDDKNQVIGYLLLAPAVKRKRVEGYNGVINVAVVVSTDNKILGVVIGDNSETASFLKRLRTGGLLKRWNGKTPAEGAKLKVDAVTRATYSSNAVKAEVEAVLDAQKK